MKTAATFKLQTIRRALFQGIAPRVQLRGGAESHQVARVRSHGHSIEIALTRGGGFLIVDPDDILSVWLPRLPTKPTPEDESQFEANVDE